MSKMPLFFIAVVAVIIVAASFRFVQQRRQNAENDAAPVLQSHVQVATKRETPGNERRSRQREVTPVEDSMRYEVWFRPLSGGLDLKMRVAAVQYHAMSVGDTGTLQYKGTRFVGFIPDPQ
ncbi:MULTISPECIES: DUF2500 domain-containing protein [Buttiauxella]|jgi:hypothetical protein|uniref:Receptor n=1 Tax=Buttiauxella ferragutiae ATCC 51602 TaxID=1354252 RepID=A0ABX2WBH2_9ENTR|nr:MULTISPECIES: DUF2500 domain-containing protein [Buttiauxella]AYN28376.1 DUF2500 domain-containing protein [Buttiauxella sp. 3AFRM03]MCE0827452.1 DUF2500 domain-containing protein [Buttiauxella ferragutiae]OAT30260.1 putative receptor [Buttiauxella ferragutiae ATCC 51602]TDN52846.1 uncharacterized protein DUF2500 [Buttiauxella sp. JUb87]UNK61513.1 DUF2500 domain-containing protein [Buttiauxella ferragutiae]